ncbi:MAG: Alpha/beta hydrolase family protein [Deltaproteobacteria bacterium]|nr:Alpha/beta hydrolase family protein [Deltaproteobacteria bacterium]
MESCDPIEVFDQPEVHHVLFYPVRLPDAGKDDPKNLFFEVEPGIRIACRFYKVQESFPTVLFFHGNGEVAPDYDEIAPFFNDIKLNLLVVDYRGYGYSDGDPTIANLLKDAKVIFVRVKQWLKDNGCSEILFVMGRSLGSLCAIEVAREYQDDLAGIIVESGSATNFRHYLGLFGLIPFEHSVWKEGKNFFNKEKIRLVKKPTLIIHAEYDSLVPLEEAKVLFANSGAENKKLIIIPRADHNSLMYGGKEQYFKGLADFVGNYATH